MSLTLPFPIHRTQQEHAPLTNQEPIALDPGFVEQTETLLPRDIGAGKVAAYAVKKYGVAGFERRGFAPDEAERNAHRIASMLPDLGFEASHTVEPLDFVLTTEGSANSLEAVNDTLENGQKAELTPVEGTHFGKPKHRKVVHVFEPTTEAAQSRLEVLESKAPTGVEAQVALEALAELASHEPRSMDGSQARGFLRNIDQGQPQPHVRLG